MKQNNVKIAVTGGIGSGKTTACNIIKTLGYPVFSCDEIYAELLEGGELTAAIAREFGYEVISEDGACDRRKLSEIVFNDKLKLEKLNEITHPAIFKEMFVRAEQCNGVVYFEVPLLFEGGYQNLFDCVIIITRGEEERISSVIARDNISMEQVKKRILSQFNYNNIDFAQYYVIHNCSNLCYFKQNIEQITKKIAEDYLK